MLDNAYTQFDLSQNELVMNVKKSSLFIRFVMFFFAFLTGLAPVLGLILTFLSGGGFSFVSLVIIGLFGLMAFYLLRIALWNTFGKENIQFNSITIIYEADYGWFKDARKELDIETNSVEFSINQVGYEDDNMGTLKIDLGEKDIICATKMPMDDLELLIEQLEKSKLTLLS